MSTPADGHPRKAIRVSFAVALAIVIAAGAEMIIHATRARLPMSEDAQYGVARPEDRDSNAAPRGDRLIAPLWRK